MSKLHCHKSPAPFITWMLHAGIMSLMCWKVPLLRSAHAIGFYVYWLLAAVTAAFYFSACYQDPGYVKNYVRRSSYSTSRAPNGAANSQSKRASNGGTVASEEKHSQEAATTDPCPPPQKPAYQRLPDPQEVLNIESLEHAGASFRISKEAADTAKNLEMTSVHATNTSLISSAPQTKAEDAIVVEERFCTTCEMLQPLRAKHCKDCDKCVALHDHHCPWLGTCVGEKNRFRFYWYLVAESALLYYSMFLVVTHFESSEADWLAYNWPQLLCTVTISVFILMVTCLTGFHTYLAASNVTTWETASWEKISYLKVWPEELGSPFDQGCLRNLKAYCCLWSSESLQEWKMPDKLPPGSQQRQSMC